MLLSVEKGRPFNLSKQVSKPMSGARRIGCLFIQTEMTSTRFGVLRNACRVLSLVENWLRYRWWTLNIDIKKERIVTSKKALFWMPRKLTTVFQLPRLFSRAYYQLHAFPRLPPPERFAAFTTAWVFSFPRLPPPECFPALATAWVFSRSCHRLSVFPLLPPPECFPTLTTAWVFIWNERPEIGRVVLQF